MPEEKVLGLASRITKPIPLAALTVLALAAVGLAIIRVGEHQVGFLGYAIVAAVAAIAILALIRAVANPKQADIAIKTAGNYSPGEVGGNYSVGSSASICQTRAANYPLPGQTTSIETKGSHSPGRVGGDYTVQQDPKRN
jgi:hypothetical protein